jgi:ribosomal protein L25 (general stress protein Ctc)
MTYGNDDTVRALKRGGSIPAALDGYYRTVSKVPVRNKQVKEAFDYLQEQCVLEVPVQARLVRVNAEVLEVFASKLDGEPKAIRQLAEILKSKLDEGGLEHGDFLVLVFDELEDW